MDGIIRDIWFGQTCLPRIFDARGHQIVGSSRLEFAGVGASRGSEGNDFRYGDPRSSQIDPGLQRTSLLVSLAKHDIYSFSFMPDWDKILRSCTLAHHSRC